MKASNIRLERLYILFILPLMAFFLAGCGTADYKAAMQAPTTTPGLIVPRIQVGDTITITLTGLPDAMPIQEKTVKEDGTITMPELGTVQVAGKTTGELENYIHDLYVPAYYRHLDVTVKASSDLVYFVRGEVKNPGRLIYVGPITVTKAITSAGDFTDFANHKHVILTRSSGQRFKLNCDKILNGEAPDPPVFPGDQIEVKRRLW